MQMIDVTCCGTLEEFWTLIGQVDWEEAARNRHSSDRRLMARNYGSTSPQPWWPSWPDWGSAASAARVNCMHCKVSLYLPKDKQCCCIVLDLVDLLHACAWFGVVELLRIPYRLPSWWPMSEQLDRTTTTCAHHYCTLTPLLHTNSSNSLPLYGLMCA